MSAPTLRGAMDLIVRFTPLISAATGLRLDIDGRTSVLTLVENADFGPVRDVVILAHLMGLWRIARLLTGRHLEATAEIALQEPTYHARFAHTVPSIRYGQRQTRALIKTTALDARLLMADAAALDLARKECEQQVETLSAAGSLVRSVRRLVWDGEGGVCSPREVAEVVHMAPRTLRRKLALHGAPLRSLLGAERRHRAISRL